MGLFPLRSSGVTTAPITDAALDFLGALSADQRERAVFPLDAEQRRMWLNIHPFVFRHGVMLEDLPPARASSDCGSSKPVCRLVASLRPATSCG